MHDRRRALLLTTLWLAALSSAQALAQPDATAPAEAKPTPTQPAAVPSDRPRNQIETRLASQAVIRRDLEFALPGGLGSDPLLLDLFVPKAGDGPFPLVIWVHGGGWEGGDKSPCPALGLLREGFAVASVNYRLTDEAIFPAQIHDVKAAVRWLRAHAKEHKLDPDRFGAWGASAGGHLVALLGTSGGVAELEGVELGHADQSSRVQAVCDWYGPCDFSIMADIAGSNNKGMLFKLFGGPLKDKRDLATLASPVTHATNDDPPFLIQQGDKDNLVPVAQSQAMETALKKAGVPVELMIVQGAGHGVLGPKANQRIREFFIRELKAASPTGVAPTLKEPAATP
jgi:acetyl esterase/lipase